MAQRRMFSLQIVDTDAFLDMSQSAQLLYFHLSMRADDDGFVANPKKVMRMIGIQDDDFKVLVAKRFLIVFKNGVCVIKHWRIHNYIQKDRYTETKYLEEKKGLVIKENGAYTECIHDVSRMDTQVRLGKDRLGKVSKDSNTSEHSSQIQKVMEVFARINPTINWGNKTSRKASLELVERFGLEGTLKMAEQIIAVHGQPFAPIAVTPYQMKEKLAQFKAYFDREKGRSELKKPKVAIIPNE